MATERVTRYVRLVVDASGAKSGGRQVQRALNDINRSAKSAAAAVNGIRRSLLTAFGGFGAIQGIRAIVGGAAQAESQFGQLAGQIEITGGAAQRTLEDITRLSEEIGVTTLASTQEVRSAAGVLLTFKNVSGDVFDSTLRLTQDLAQAGFGNLRTNAVQLGKALNDPIRGLDGLSRAGIQFTDSQKEVIRSLATSGDLVGAQSIVLAELNAQVGGAGVAAAQGFSGALDNVIERAKLFAEAFGGQALNPFAGFLNVVSSGIARITDNLSAFNGAIVGVATVAIPKLAMSARVLAAFNPFTAMLAAGAALGSVLGNLLGQTVTFGTSTASLGGILRTVWQDGRAVVGEFLTDAINGFGDFIERMGMTANEGGSMFGHLTDAAKSYLNFSIGLFKSLTDIAVGAFSAIGKAGAALWRGLISGGASFGRAFTEALRGNFAAARAELGNIADGFDFSSALTSVKASAEIIGDNFGTDFVGNAAGQIDPYLADLTQRAAEASGAVTPQRAFDLSGLGGADPTGGGGGRARGVTSPTMALEEDTSTEAWAARTKTALDSVGGSFDKLAGLAESSLGRQAGAYKAAFAITKATALATAIVNTSQAITEALKLPPPTSQIQAGIAAAAGAAEIATITAQAIGGFEAGGYTGNMGTKQVAGVVHGQEFVVNAQATRRNRATLEAMNAGASPSAAAGGNVKVIVVDDRQTAEQYLSGPDGEKTVMAHVGRNQS